jgi:FMN phosphatase YigB (HAD superfamily)
MTSRLTDKPVVVLDVGGVLVDIDLDVLFTKLSKRLGKNLKAPAPVAFDRLFFPVQLGEKSFEDIIPVLNDSLGVTIRPDEWRDLGCSIFTGEVPGMKEMLLQLKSHFFLVGLTNTIEVHWTFLLKNYEILRLIDSYVISYKEGLAKPDPGIYQVVMDRYCEGRSPYFHTDDTPEYVEAARKMGWRSEVFRSPSQFKNDLLRINSVK